MRLLVFGTSNSILKNGYVDALRNHPDVSRLERIGPGGSTSVMLPYVGADVIFSEYDYVVLDASVNDGAFLEWGLLRPDEIRENLLWVCKAALRAGCVPVFLCMPNRLHLDVGDQALGVYRAVADAVGLALVDGYAFVRATAETDGVPAADLFKDDLHLLPEVSARLAPRIIAACRPATGASAAAAALGPAVRFRLIRAADLDLPISKRSTSLMEVDGVKIVVGQKLALQLNEGEQLCGAAYNAGHSFGSLIVAGNTKVAVNVRSHYFRKHDLVATVRQVSPAVAPQDGVVEVFLQKAEDVTAELLGFVVRCEGGDQAKDPSAVPTPPELTFPRKRPPQSPSFTPRPA
ncbi:SGNH/GDSL hydrolase family protein [Paracoccus cavernae]|uniref:SGNH/GDSL hydrolase family protein n=1 Tax=Paracoccus cavernae TaxID=1571207 RepID=UPI0036425A2F